MKFLKLTVAALLLAWMAFSSPAMAKKMNETDVNGSFYAVEMMDPSGSVGGPFSMSFLELTVDDLWKELSFSRLAPEGEAGSVEYTVFNTGMLSLKEHPAEQEWFGAAKGAVSQNGNYMVLGDMVYTQKGGVPSLLFAIKKTSEPAPPPTMSGPYNLFIFYTSAAGVFNTNAGTFTAAPEELSGTFSETDQPLTGGFNATYTIGQDGKLTLTPGPTSYPFGVFQGGISEDGHVFAAVETSPEDGNQAFVVGVRQREAGLTLADLKGRYWVDDFGYYAFGGEAPVAAGFLMDMTFPGDETPFSFFEKDATCQCEACPIDENPDQKCDYIGTTFNGTLTVAPGGQLYRYDISGYPEGLKQGGQLSLSPEGTLLALRDSAYLGIGLQQATGERDPGQPIAAAGPDQTVAPNETVTLDASGSTDAEEGGEIVSYKWLAITGTPALVSAVPQSADTDVVEFPAPDVGGDVTYRLIVTDDAGNTDADVVKVTVTGSDPGPDPAQADDGNTGGGGGGDDSGCFIHSLLPPQ